MNTIVYRMNTFHIFPYPESNEFKCGCLLCKQNGMDCCRSLIS